MKKPEPMKGTSQSLGLRAMDAAAEAFRALSEQDLDGISQQAIAEARAILAVQQIVRLDTARVIVTNKSWQTKSAPSLTATLSLTAS